MNPPELTGNCIAFMPENAVICNLGSASGSGVPPGLQIQCFLPKAGRVGSIPTRSRQKTLINKRGIAINSRKTYNSDDSDYDLTRWIGTAFMYIGIFSFIAGVAILIRFIDLAVIAGRRMGLPVFLVGYPSLTSRMIAFYKNRLLFEGISSSFFQLLHRMRCNSEPSINFYCSKVETNSIIGLFS
jgi:hypothetical protein